MKIGWSSFLWLALFLGCQNQHHNQDQSQQSNEGAALPKLERIQLVDLDGNKIDLDQYRGKRVFINFWATWCKPCIKEMPDISSATDSLAGEEYVFLAASDEDMERIRKFASKYDFSFTFVKMKNSAYDLDIPALPSSMVIDRTGKIVFDEVGARDWDSPAELAHLRSY